MNDWLREQVDQYRAYLRTKPRVELYQVEIDAFVDWLERTGATPWRSVEDGLPPTGDDKWYVVETDSGFVIAVKHDKKRDWEMLGVVRWTPVPPLPKEDNDD